MPPVEVAAAIFPSLSQATAPTVTNSKDSVRLLTSEGHVALDRNTIKLVQTPQAFHSKILLAAYNIDYKDRFTDEATVVEAFGIKVNLIEGEINNIKITTAGDLFFAQQLLTDPTFRENFNG